MHEAHDALTCIGEKTYINEKNRIKYSNEHYLKSNEEMSSHFFKDLPEALENNFNLPFKCNFRPKNSLNQYYQILALKKVVVQMKYLKKIH